MEKQLQNGIFTVPVHLGTTYSEIYKYKSIRLQKAREMIDDGDHDKIFSFEVKKSQKIMTVTVTSKINVGED